MIQRQHTDYIVIHCAATRPSQNIGSTDIDRWHREKGYDCIGYHYVICRDGSIEVGRPLNTVGSHVYGYNKNSVGICLVGGVSEDDFRIPENNFTAPQFQTLKKLLRDVKSKYMSAKILGHRDLNEGKACPSFDVKSWMQKEKIS